jgi:hypothetical protein
MPLNVASLRVLKPVGVGSNVEPTSVPRVPTVTRTLSLLCTSNRNAKVFMHPPCNIAARSPGEPQEMNLIETTL